MGTRLPIVVNKWYNDINRKRREDTKMENEKIKAIPFRLDTAEHKKLKLFCVEKGIPMQQFIEKAVDEYMKKWVV